MYLNNKGSVTTTYELMMWIGIIILIAFSIGSFLILTSLAADTDKDVSEIKHFTLKQSILDSCIKSNLINLDENILSRCVNLDNNYGINLILKDLDSKLIKEIILNKNMVNRMPFCNLDKKLRCSTFKNILLVNNTIYILKIEVLNEYQ